MGLFNRKNKNTTIAELEKYYSGNANQNGMNWLKAMLTFVITVALIFGVVIGTKAIFKKTLTIQGPLTEINVDQPGTTSSAVKPSGSTTTPNDVAPSEDGVVTEKAATSTRQAGDYATNTETASKGTPISDIPNTGAGESLVLILAGVLFLGYYYSRKRFLKKLR